MSETATPDNSPSSNNRVPMADFRAWSGSFDGSERQISVTVSSGGVVIDASTPNTRDGFGFTERRSLSAFLADESCQQLIGTSLGEATLVEVVAFVRSLGA